MRRLFTLGQRSPPLLVGGRVTRTPGARGRQLPGGCAPAPGALAAGAWAAGARAAAVPPPGGRTAAVDAEPLGDGVEPLSGVVDRFGGVTVTLGPEDAADVGSLEVRLRASLATWRGAGRCAAWVRVPRQAYSALPTVLAQGFDWHHAKAASQAGPENPEGYALLARWLAEDEPSRIPAYANTQVGVGGLVLNREDSVLLIKERVSPSAKIHGLWKLPGGLADRGEDLGTAAAREVLEETGVHATAEGVVCIHHRHGYAHGVSDLYFTVKMRAQSVELAAQASEVMEATWMPLEEAQRSPEVMPFNRRILMLASKPVLVPHSGLHGSSIAPRPFFVYASAASLDSATGKPSGCDGD